MGKNDMRFILKEGHMRLVEKQGKKDVYIFLFTDCLIVTKLKKNSDKYRIIRQPYRLDRVVFHCLKDHEQIFLVYLDEFEVAISACILQTDTGEHNKWKSCLHKAKETYESNRGKLTSLQDDGLLSVTSASSIDEINVLASEAKLEMSDDAPIDEANAITQKSDPETAECFEAQAPITPDIGVVLEETRMLTTPDTGAVLEEPRMLTTPDTGAVPEERRMLTTPDTG